MASPYNDAAGNRSARRVAAAGRRSAAHIEIEARNVARKIGHHSLANFMETMRQRGAALNPDFAARIWKDETGKDA